jgi:effector-binding domain-containing protein
MNTQIINNPFSITIYGFSGIAINRDYSGKAFQLMDKMWNIVKGKGIKNKGKNIWVYEPDHMVFAGVELEDISDNSSDLEMKQIDLAQYGYYKHTGPYQLIKQAGTKMTEEIRQKGFETILPYIEIYGHWDNDESKLETELLMCIK